MKAFIMAAGKGTRLRPLTHDVPKPMLPIVNKPPLEHTLELLSKHGIKEVVINLHHHGSMVKRYFGHGSKWGVSITYSEEKELMGTAGGVKKSEAFFDDTFLVMSGDGLTDINLQEAINFHKKKKALATMILKQVDARFEYGVVMVDKSRRIRKFLEKPTWSSIAANAVNTGIYIFEPRIFKYIPKNKFYDFGHDVWPSLLKKKEKIFAYEMSGYWCDIGNLQEYRKAQYDVLGNHVKIKMPGKRITKNVWVGLGTKIEHGVRLKGPCVIGNNCTIKKGVTIDEFTVIGNNALIKQGAVIKNCIVWNDVCINKHVHLNNCIIGNKANIKSNISVFEGSVINIETIEEK
ncbi:MAG: NDP-sugar synthase [bacterium]